MKDCSNINEPTTNRPLKDLPSGVEPFPPCHSTHTPNVWRSYDGTELPYSMAAPEKNLPKAVVLLFPGWDGVTSDYKSISSTLAHNGIAVYGSENRTFVYGPPLLQGQAKSWLPWVKDVIAFAHFVKGLHPDLPLFWHGHSFGAAQVIQAAAESTGVVTPAGIIVHSPGFAYMFESRKLLRGIFYGSIAWLTLPHLRMIEQRNTFPTTDEIWNYRWLHSSDRLRKGYKVNYLIECAHMGIEARKSSRHLKIPVLSLWGGKDRFALGGKESLRKEYDHYMRNELAPDHNTLNFWSEGGHLLTEGGTKNECLATIISWLNDKIQS